jgi:hypothetical protein
MTAEYNACSLGPQSAEEAKKLNWHRMDCLANRNIKKFDIQAALKWFAAQDEEWQISRKVRLQSRLNERRW